MKKEEILKAESIIQGENFAIYGEHRSGKSTVASQFPNPCFLAGEPGIKYLKIPDSAKKYAYTWQDVVRFSKTIMEKKHNYKTIVFDTVDSFNNLATEYICTSENVQSLMDTDRKKGYDFVRKELWRVIHPIAMDKDLTLIMLFHLKIVELKPKNKEKYNRWTINFTDKSKELLFTYPHHIMLAYFKKKDDEEERRLRTAGSQSTECGSWNPNVESKMDIALSYEAILKSTL